VCTRGARVTLVNWVTKVSFNCCSQSSSKRSTRSRSCPLLLAFITARALQRAARYILGAGKRSKVTPTLFTYKKKGYYQLYYVYTINHHEITSIDFFCSETTLINSAWNPDSRPLIRRNWCEVIRQPLSWKMWHKYRVVKYTLHALLVRRTLVTIYRPRKY